MSSKKDKSNNLDKYFMGIAMNLAEERIGLTGLNPSVGCVIVKLKTKLEKMLFHFVHHFQYTRI